MAFTRAGGTSIYYEISGSTGEHVIFVHGSWSDHSNWDLVIPFLSGDFRVLVYDRRGHGSSERIAVPGHVEEDVADLAALIEEHRCFPAHVVGNSFGGSIVLRLAASRPDLLRSMSVHEPPVFSLLDPSLLEPMRPPMTNVLELIASGEHRSAARAFAETIALGPGSWDQLTDEIKDMMTFNAPTFLDEQQDPNWLKIDLQALAAFPNPVLFTRGEQSPKFYSGIINRLAETIKQSRVVTIPEAGHLPQLTHPEEYSKLLRKFFIPR